LNIPVRGMTNKQSELIAGLVLVFAVVAAAGYMTRNEWMGRIVPQKAAPGASKGLTAGGQKVKVIYTCPMHTQIVKPSPADCPICGMTLVKKEIPAEGGQAEDKGGMEGMPGMEAPSAPQGGQASSAAPEATRVSLGPTERLKARVRTVAVVRKQVSQDVFTVGKVDYDEKGVRKISSRFAGRIEKLHVNFTGQKVKKGEKIYSIYSPDIVSTEKEYLLAKATAVRLTKSDFPEIAHSADGVLDAARSRLKLWGLTDAQVDELDKTGEVKTALDVYAPMSGTVTEIAAREGDYVMEGGEVYKLADLGRVWALADVYETELSKVSMGSVVEVTAEAYPGKTFHGRVSFINPMVDPETRTTKVRAEFPNPGGALKPEMFVNVKIYSKPLNALVIPASAVIYTGRHDVAWVEVGQGEFERRELKLGMRSGDFYQALSGVSEGEKVVADGGFLLDSEAELRKSAGGMAGMDMGEKPAVKEKPKGKEKAKEGMPGMPGM